MLYAEAGVDGRARPRCKEGLHSGCELSKPPFDHGLATVRAKGWRVYEVACGHDVMLDMPDRLTEILDELA
jgi:hypothetical protein